MIQKVIFFDTMKRTKVVGNQNLSDIRLKSPSYDENGRFREFCSLSSRTRRGYQMIGVGFVSEKKF